MFIHRQGRRKALPLVDWRSPSRSRGSCSPRVPRRDQRAVPGYLVSEGTCEVSRTVDGRTEILGSSVPEASSVRWGCSLGRGASRAYLLTGVAALVATGEALEREIGRADWMRSCVEAGIEQFAELDEIRGREASPRLVAGNESVARPGIHRRIRWYIWETSVRARQGSRTPTSHRSLSMRQDGMCVSCPAEWTAYQLRPLCLTHLADPELARPGSHGRA
jgi:hypothetical protein